MLMSTVQLVQSGIFSFSFISAYVMSPKDLFLFLHTLRHMYDTPLSTLILSLSLNHNLYADDSQLFLFYYCASVC